MFYSSTIKWVLFSNIVSLTVNVTNTEDESFICILIKIMRDSHKRIIFLLKKHFLKKAYSEKDGLYRASKTCSLNCIRDKNSLEYLLFINFVRNVC